MNVGCAKGFDPSEILDHTTGLGVEQGLVDPKNMAIPMNEDYWSRESQAFGLKRTEEFIVGCFCLFLRQLDETLDNETALFSAFVPLSTIHWCRKQWDIGRPLRSRLPRPL